MRFLTSTEGEIRWKGIKNGHKRKMNLNIKGWIRKYQNKIIWTCFKNEWRENPKEGFEHENKRKAPIRKAMIKEITD